jgi:hypothetical protein
MPTSLLPCQVARKKTAGYDVLLQNNNAAANARVLLLLPMLWLNWKRACPRTCVQASLALRHAYGQLGIRAELRAVELVASISTAQACGRSGFMTATPAPATHGPPGTRLVHLQSQPTMSLRGGCGERYCLA